MGASPASRQPAPAPRPIVLVVEDRANARKLLVRALALAAARPPRVVVLDLRLPDAGDLEAFEAIRARVRAHIIIVSGFLSTEITVEAMAQGALHVFEKPFRIDAFVRAVNRALAKPIPAARRPIDRSPAARLVTFNPDGA